MEIKCPHCNKSFDMSDEAAGLIRDQIRTKAFEKEVNDKVKTLRESAEADVRVKVSDAVMREREKCSDKLIEAQKAISEAEAKATDIQNKLDNYKIEAALEAKKAELELTEKYSKQISDLESEKKDIERELDYYKDLKARMSTKMIGESLERHCETEFNKIRMLAFPNAEFHKDNEVSKASGSKGDYIFREFDADGVELISIMFEMKNEADTTATKKTNESFFKELDKDRREKKCEYAVLVTLLEADNELYNQGIVDVSYQYEKMYVIRPQFFIPFISLVRNAALKTLEMRQELTRIENRNIDIKHFEEAFIDFKGKFSYNYIQAGKRFDEAIDELDKTIEHLQAVRDKLTMSKKQLGLANDKIEGMTVEKLTSKSPSLLESLADSGNQQKGAST
jgi:hypothetical protein